MFLIYRYRVKNHLGLLNSQARAVNFVWNYCNDRQKDAIRFGRKWLSFFDLTKLTSGSTKELGIHSDTLGAICRRYVESRTSRQRPYLRYRGRQNLPWIPIRGRCLRETPSGFHFHGREFKVFKSRDLPAGAKLVDGGNFACDARGNWFLNVCVEIPDVAARATASGVGIDLGLKDFAALSTGEKIENPRYFRALENRLAIALRARKKRQAANVHARIANKRGDFLHKLSRRIVREFDYIAVGNVNAAGLAKTSMAKSVHDAGWSSFRNMLRYKAIAHGATYEEVREAFSTQVCSSCGSLPPGRPRGIAGLGIRQWVCSDCGAEHDRDLNAALNLLARSGHRAPVEGALA